MPMLSRTQAVHLDGTGKPKEVDHVRLREVFLSRATKFFQCETDADRDRLRERVKDAAYGLEAPEIAALAEAARRRARGAVREMSPLVAPSTQALEK